MVVLISAVLIIAALCVLAAVGDTVRLPVLAGGLVLLLIVAAMVGTLPSGQNVCLPAALSGGKGTPAWRLLGLVATCAAAGGGAATWALTGLLEPLARGAEASGRPSPMVLLQLGMAGGCVLIALLAAALGQISVPHSLLLGLFAGVAVGAAIELREALQDGLPEIRSHWGGLGGGLGGWEVSRPAVLLLVLAVCVGAALVVGLSESPSPSVASWVYSSPC